MGLKKHNKRTWLRWVSISRRIDNGTPMSLQLTHLKHKDAKIFGNHLNTVMLVFIGKLSLSTLK